VLPLAAKAIGGVRVVEESWPYAWGYGGLLVEGGDLRADEAALVLDDLRRRRRIRTTVVPMPRVARPWNDAASSSVQRLTYHSQIIDLRGGFGGVWGGYSKSARWSARRAERLGVEVERDVTGAFMPHFARLYDASVARWAEQRGQPLSLMRLLARYRDRAGQASSVAESLGEQCVAWMATWRGEPVAVNLVLVHGAYAHSWMSVNDYRLARETRGTMLLESLIHEDACSRGASYFLLGESEPGSAVEDYKRQFGATRVAYAALRLEPVPFTPTATRARAVVERLVQRRPPAASHRDTST